MLHKIQTTGMAYLCPKRLETSGRSFNSNNYIEAGRMSTEDLVIDSFAKQLVCPVCTDEEVTQPMMQCGDFPNNLFCPHCDLGIEFSRPFGLGSKLKLIYTDYRIRKFIKRRKDEHNRQSR